jgi:hypothetical protein
MANDFARVAPAPRLLAGQYDFVVTAPAPTLEAQAEITPTFAFAGIAPAPAFSAAALTGFIVTAELRAPAPLLASVLNNPPILTVVVSAPAPLLSSAAFTGVVATVSAVATAPILAAAGYPQYVATALLRAAAPRLNAILSAPIAVAFRTWALNTRKAALSEYGPEFAFNSFTTFQGHVLACGASGVVVLGAQSADNTTAITGRVRTGQEGFESAFHKRVPRLYTSYSSDGDMLFRTITEGGTRTYSLPANGITRLQQRRIPVGKGPKSRFWQFELENVGGADFNVDDVLVLPTKLRRRVQ